MDREATPPPRIAEPGWRFGRDPRTGASLGALNARGRVPGSTHWLRRFLAFLGPGYLVSVGYMDPGNWATDLAGGSQFGYTLLCVIALSNVMAIVLQALAARLGIATGRDLAQACRDHYPRPVAFALWVVCEIAIIACDLAEVIGTAIALNLLFGIPLVLGAIITAVDVFLVLYLMRHGFRALEAFIIAMLLVIFACFGIQIALAAPPVAEVLGGFIPRAEVVTNPAALYIAIGIIGATVMPHNLYLHSSIVQTRDYPRNDAGKRMAIRWAVADSTIALMLALFINASILIMAATVFHKAGHTDVQEIEQAYALLSPMLGIGIASTLFAVALLASGLNSTVTATLAGQIVMEGFLHLRLPTWARRLVTRGIAIVPVVVITALYGSEGTAKLLVFSQVLLSMQLPFAVIPLVRFVTDREKMGRFVVAPWLASLAWVIAATIVVLNVKLLVDPFAGGCAASASAAAGCRFVAFGHVGQRPAPACVAVGDQLLQPRRRLRPALDAGLRRDGRPALVVRPLPGFHERTAGATDYLRQRAGVVHVAGRPVALVDQFVDQLARRGVVAHQFVDEGAAVAAAVGVDVGQLGVDPGVAAARAPGKGVVLGRGRSRQQQASRQRERAAAGGQKGGQRTAPPARQGTRGDSVASSRGSGRPRESPVRSRPSGSSG